jgi:peptidoglycan/LPS O-acetylase OafA/YrhL
LSFDIVTFQLPLSILKTIHISNWKVRPSGLTFLLPVLPVALRTGISSLMHRITALDALRGVAALLVVLFHLTLHHAESEYGFKFGVTGVDLFFIISGYVIYMTLNRTHHWRDFVVARLSRLYPAYWTAVTLTAIWMLIGIRLGKGGLEAHEYVANLTMFQHYFHVRDLDGPYWTLLIEMLFYALMLGLFLTKQLPRLETWGYALIAFQFGWHTIVAQHHNDTYQSLCRAVPLLDHFQLFFAGIIFYLIQNQGFRVHRVAGIVACYTLSVHLFPLVGVSRIFLSQPEYAAVVAVYFVLFALLLAGKLAWLVNRVTVFLGTISYSLYLNHQYLGTGIVDVLNHRFHWPFWWAVLVALTVIFMVASAVTFWVEKPALAWIRRTYRPQKTKPTN